MANHQLNFTEEETDPLIKQMVDRLSRAAADDEMRRKMDLEDEYEDTYVREFRELNDKAEQATQQVEEEKQRAEEEKQRAEQLYKELEELKKRFNL